MHKRPKKFVRRRQVLCLPLPKLYLHHAVPVVVVANELEIKSIGRTVVILVAKGQDKNPGLIEKHFLDLRRDHYAKDGGSGAV